MEEKIIEISELQKRIGGFQEIPKGNEETGYVFFQSKNDMKFAVATEKKKLMAAELRMGKYDRIMKISRGRFYKVIKKNIACKEMGHWFKVEVRANYYIEDVAYIYLNKTYEVGAEIEKALARLEFELGEEFGFREKFQLKKALTEAVDSCVQKLKYLDIRYDVDIWVDETAEEIIKNELTHEINRSKDDLDAIESMAKQENNFEIRQAHLEQEEMISRKQGEIQQEKVNRLGKIFKEYGSNAGRLLDLSEGKISGESMTRDLNQDKRANIELLMQMYQNGLPVEDLVKGMVSNMMLDNREVREALPERLESGLERSDAWDGAEGEDEKALFQWSTTDKGDETI